MILILIIAQKKKGVAWIDTTEEAAKAYDEATVLMSGRSAKTNSPVVANQTRNGQKTQNSQSPVVLLIFESGTERPVRNRGVPAGI